jgi:Fe-S-cluster-containing dehydrogenase component
MTGSHPKINETGELVKKTSSGARTCAEELFSRRPVEARSGNGHGWRLYIDLDICLEAGCEGCRAECTYDLHPGNRGIVAVRELATYELICRRCEHPHCVDACPHQALEQGEEDHRLIRHLLRCVGCRSCSLACPYGTILPDLLPHRAHNCDYCLDRRNHGQLLPVCVSTCPYGALGVRDTVQEVEANTFLLGEQLVVHSVHWKQAKA